MRIDPTLKQDLKTYLQKKIHSKSRKVTVYSTYPLSKAEMKLLETKLPVLKESDMTNEIDREILGGLIIKFGSKMIDLSIRRQLLNLKKVMYERT